MILNLDIARTKTVRGFSLSLFQVLYFNVILIQRYGSNITLSLGIYKMEISFSFALWD